MTDTTRADSAMPDVVWPSAEAAALRAAACELADLIQDQRSARQEFAAQARRDWSGRSRRTFDGDHEAPTEAAGDNLAAGLRAMAGTIDGVERWVRDENGARRQARDRRHDNTTWCGLKRYANLVGDFLTGD
jgi:hypothetical protein